MKKGLTIVLGIPGAVIAVLGFILGFFWNAVVSGFNDGKDFLD